MATFKAPTLHPSSTGNVFNGIQNRSLNCTQCNVQIEVDKRLWFVSDSCGLKVPLYLNYYDKKTPESVITRR